MSSYVDIEGTVVWTQEYLRYRLNGCLHTEAVDRVLAQIDGRGIQPVCGSETPEFPPRNQPFDFRVALESKYRDGLRRQPSTTYVDTEGDIVWTQEYLRYRVSGCMHTESVDKVFAQIDGRGVQPDCRVVVADNFAGRWQGRVQIAACSQAGAFTTIGWCSSFRVGAADSYELNLTQSGSNVSGSLDLGGIVFPVSGNASGSQLRLSGQTLNSGITLVLENWGTSISGRSMVGQFGWVATYSGLTGNGRNVFNLVNVSRDAAAAPTSAGWGDGRSLSDVLQRVADSLNR